LTCVNAGNGGDWKITAGARFDRSILMNRYAALGLLALMTCADASLAAAPAKTTGDTPQARRTTRALNLLEAQGFAADLQEKSASAFRDFHEQGKGFIATVSQKGRNYVVTVDPETGEVKHQD
jgi:hypothetical protein